MEERLKGKLANELAHADAGIYPENGRGCMAESPWRSMDAVVREAWLQVGHHVWIEAYEFLSDVWRLTQNRGHWRYPNPACYLFPWEWVKSVDPYARRVGLDRVVDRMKELTAEINAAFAEA